MNQTEKIEIIYTFCGATNKPMWALRHNQSIAYKLKRDLLKYLDFEGPLDKLEMNAEVNENGFSINRPIYVVEYTKNQKGKVKPTTRQFDLPQTVEEAATNYKATGELSDLDIIAKFVLKNYINFIRAQCMKRSDYEENDPESIVNELLIRMFKSIQKWDSYKFTTWIHSCIINEIRDYYCKKKRFSDKHSSINTGDGNQDYIDDDNWSEMHQHSVEESITDSIEPIPMNDDSIGADRLSNEDEIFQRRRNALDMVIESSFDGLNREFIRDYFTGSFKYKDLMVRYNLVEHEVKNRIFLAKKIISKNPKIKQLRYENII